MDLKKNLRQIVKKWVYHLQYKKLKNKATLLGTHYNVGPHHLVMYKDGSTSECIKIGDHVDVYGCLYSQSGGKITIGNYCQIGLHSRLRSVDSISLGDRVVVSEGVIITDNNSHPTAPLFQWYRAQMLPSSSLHLWKHSGYKSIIIEDNVWIGEFARICKGVRIGKNSVIAANAVVTKDVPRNSIAAGNPAKIVKTDLDRMPLPTTCPEFDELIKKYGTNFK